MPLRRSLVLIMLFVVSALLIRPEVAMAASGTMEATWVITPVDTSGHINQGGSLALGSSGEPHIAYYNPVEGVLKYARWVEKIWQVEDVTLPGAGGSNFSLTIDSEGAPVIAFFDASHALQLARKSGETWLFHTVDGRGGCCVSLVTGASGLHIGYQGKSQSGAQQLTHAFSADGAAWIFKAAPSNYADPIAAVDLAVSSGGVVIGYRDGKRAVVVEKGASGWHERLTILNQGSAIAVESNAEGRISTAFDASALTQIQVRIWDGEQWAQTPIMTRAGSLAMAQSPGGTVSLVYTEMPFGTLNVISSIENMSAIEVVPVVGAAGVDMASGETLVLAFYNTSDKSLYIAERSTEPVKPPVDPTPGPPTCGLNVTCTFLPLIIH